MNIIDAIKSGKKIKRASQVFHNPNIRSFTKSDVLASDWEVEEEKIQVSKDDLERLVAESIFIRFQYDVRSYRDLNGVTVAEYVTNFFNCRVGK